MSKGKWRTYGVFGCAMMASAAVLAITFIVCWRRFDSQRSATTTSFLGIPDSMAAFIAAAYTPVIGATFTGFRDAVSSQLLGESKPLVLNGAAFYYVLALSGVLAALVCVIYISTGVDMTVAKELTGMSAAYWGVSIGWIFDKIFRRITMPELVPAVLPAAQPAPVEKI